MKLYNDVFVEELIVQGNGGTKALLRLGVLAASSVLFLLVWLYIGNLLPTEYANVAVSVIFLALCAAVFFTFRYTVLEYEYSFFSGDVDIDKIKGRRRRKTVMSFSCKDVEIMAPYKPSYASEYGGSFDRTLDASTSKRSPNRWFIIYKTEAEERVLFIFEPSQRMQDAFKQFLRGGKFKEE